jgi:hypothetical protein
VIPVAKGYTIAAGHRLGIAIGVLHSQNTVADQIFYDSDKYPSGLTIVPGSIANISVCGVPGVPVKEAAGKPTEVKGSQTTRPAAASGLPPTGRTSPAVPAFGLVLVALVLRRATRRPT